MIRPIAADDVARARSFLDAVSWGTRYFRFGRGDFRMSESELIALCNPDPARRCQLLVVRQTPAGDSIVASGRYVVEDALRCEFAIFVLDDWQHRGVGRRLMLALMAAARANGLRRMQGLVLGSNRRMLAFVESLGFVLDPDSANQQIKRVLVDL